MNEPIGINPENRRDTSSKKATGFTAEGLDYRDLNEVLLKSHCDHIWGSSAQCTANTATFYTNNTTGAAYDKDAVLVTFADDDKILISHSAATVNMKLDCGGSKIRIEMSKAENWDLGTKNLTLGVTAGDSFSGDLELAGTGTLTVLESNGLRIHHTAMTLAITAGDYTENNIPTPLPMIIWRFDGDATNEDPVGVGGGVWEISDTTVNKNEATLGGLSVTESSGIFSFATTGYWAIRFYANTYAVGASAALDLDLQSTINNSTYANLASADWDAASINDRGVISGEALINVTDTSLQKVKLRVANTNSRLVGSGSKNLAYIVFEKKHVSQ